MTRLARPIMVCLVGEQPVPNLLAVRHFCPGKVVLAFTDEVKSTAERLRTVLGAGFETHLFAVSGFNLEVTETAVSEFITRRSWEPGETAFNLTGGTKVMTLAAYRLAERWKSPFFYVASGKRGPAEVYAYEFGVDGALRSSSERLPSLLTLDEYFKVHLGRATFKDRFDPGRGGRFEEGVVAVLRPVVDEIRPGVQHLGAIDVDLAFRIGNQVGVAELKTAEQRQIDVKAAASLSLRIHREMYGTYTKRFLIVSAAAGVHPDLPRLTQALDTTLIELPSFATSDQISADDGQRLIREVHQSFRG